MHNTVTHYFTSILCAL